MSTKVSEIDALKGIDEYLEQLTEEERQRVFSFIASKYGLQNSTKATNNNSGGSNNSNNNSQNNNSGQNNNGDLTIKQFIATKKPDGFYEQIACLAYYLEKHGDLSSFKTKDITKANTDARSSKIPNPSLYVAHTKTTYGFLSPVGGGKLALSARGEALVEALPDRAAVKTALEEHPIKKKSASKKKAAKK